MDKNDTKEKATFSTSWVVMQGEPPDLNTPETIPLEIAIRHHIMCQSPSDIMDETDITNLEGCDQYLLAKWNLPPEQLQEELEIRTRDLVLAIRMEKLGHYSLRFQKALERYFDNRERLASMILSGISDEEFIACALTYCGLPEDEIQEYRTYLHPDIRHDTLEEARARLLVFMKMSPSHFAQLIPSAVSDAINAYVYSLKSGEAKRILQDKAFDDLMLKAVEQ